MYRETQATIQGGVDLVGYWAGPHFIVVRDIDIFFATVVCCDFVRGMLLLLMLMLMLILLLVSSVGQVASRDIIVPISGRPPGRAIPQVGREDLSSQGRGAAMDYGNAYNGYNDCC